MKLTAIKQQLKQRDRYSLYIDGKYSFSLSEGALLSSGLASGQELTARQLEDYRQQSADDKLYNRTLRYVALRPHSVWEVETYLRRKQMSPEAMQPVIARLLKLNLLNDHEFAEVFVRNRQLLRPTSIRRLQLELRQKHVAAEVISAALQSGALSEADSLQAVIIKKRRQLKYRDNDKLMQYLSRQGFGYSAIKAALQAELL